MANSDFATVTLDHFAEIGNTNLATVTFKNPALLNGMPVDPTTITCTQIDPDGTQTSLVVTRAAQGSWYAVPTFLKTGIAVVLFAGTIGSTLFSVDASVLVGPALSAVQPPNPASLVNWAKTQAVVTAGTYNVLPTDDLIIIDTSAGGAAVTLNFEAVPVLTTRHTVIWWKAAATPGTAPVVSGNGQTLDSWPGPKSTVTTTSIGQVGGIGTWEWSATKLSWILVDVEYSGTNIGVGTGQTVTLNQGGTPTVPTVETFWKIQPQNNPNASTKAPFVVELGGAANADGTTFDHVCNIGYNSATLYSTTEPQVGISIESQFNNTGSVYSTELHLLHGTSIANGSITTRCFSSNMNRATGSLGVAHQFYSVLNDPIAGQWYIRDFATNTTWAQWNGVNAVPGSVNDYISFGPNPAQSGAVRLPQSTSSYFATALTARSKLGAYDIALVAINTIDEITFGQTSLGTPVGATDFLFYGRTQAQGGSTLVPAVDNDMSLGTAANRWRVGWIMGFTCAALTVAQTTKSANYTIDSGTTPDGEVWVNSSTAAFTVTLPTPTAGRKLWIVDSGNSLATHNVTLARHGSENINGSAASLALVTSGARYEVSSDGTNWWVNKMVLGG